ncbi:hypothetical protein [Pseudoalteromonas neustonica]|uniref:hypothetical protein n=1 Tax=Pseudoalteromonas neustonica TaxID=1840331 RepID=UPI001C948B35|nr:hypothetical protein [Pseudoalteromonas neustonica]
MVNTPNQLSQGTDQAAEADLSKINTISYQDALADITRQQFEDYKNRFLPVQEQLFDLATNDTLLTEQMERNGQSIDRAFNQSKQSESMALGRYGLAPDNSKQDSNNTGLLKSLTTASVNNETRSSVDDLQNKILTGQGGAPKGLAEIGNK